MDEPRLSARSVRVRITAAAVVVVGLTMAAASFTLVTAVRHQLVQGLHAQSQAKVKEVAAQLAKGIAPDGVAVGRPGAATGFVTVQDANGNVVKAFGTGPGGAGPGGPGTILISGEQVPAGEIAGVKLDTTGTPFDVRYQQVPTETGALTVFAGAPLDGIQRSISALEGALEVGFPFLLAVVGALAWVITGRALRPVEAIRSEVEEITGGTLHRRVPDLGTGDEVSRLARTMNAMLDRLERSSAQQRQFVADASHELRSPIATIRAQLEVALAHPGAADWPGVAQRALVEESRLEALVNDLLLLASADEQRGRDVSGAVDVDLVALVHEEAARTRAVGVSVTAAAGLVVSGRPDRLRRVIANLLDNACRYASTAVAVELRQDGDLVELLVDDDGPGVPPEDRERIFERFTLLDPSRARAGHSGAGLGLALVKAVVEHHGGAVSVLQSPAGGARFVVRLPAAPSSWKRAHRPSQLAGHSSTGCDELGRPA